MVGDSESEPTAVRWNTSELTRTNGKHTVVSSMDDSVRVVVGPAISMFPFNVEGDPV